MWICCYGKNRHQCLLPGDSSHKEHTYYHPRASILNFRNSTLHVPPLLRLISVIAPPKPHRPSHATTTKVNLTILAIPPSPRQKNLARPRTLRSIPCTTQRSRTQERARQWHITHRQNGYLARMQVMRAWIKGERSWATVWECWGRDGWDERVRGWDCLFGHGDAGLGVRLCGEEGGWSGCKGRWLVGREGKGIAKSVIEMVMFGVYLECADEAWMRSS